MQAEFLKILFDKMPSAVFICDKNTRVVEINSSFRKMFRNDVKNETGLFCGNTIGCSYVVDENAMCGETEYCVTCKIRKAIEKALLRNEDTEGQIVHRDFYINGKKIEKYFRFSTKLITYKNDDMVMIIVDDITELEKKKLEVIDLDRQKNKMITSISHDLQGPLSAIIGFADVLKEKAGDEFIRDFGDYVELIRNAVDHSLVSLDNLIDYSRVLSSSVELKISKFRPVQTLKNTINSNSFEAEKKGISIKLVCDDENIIQEGDMSKTWHIFDNLMRFVIASSRKNCNIIVRSVSEKSQFITEISFRHETPISASVKNLFNAQPITIDKSNLGIALSMKFAKTHRGTLKLSNSGEHNVLTLQMPIKIRM